MASCPRCGLPLTKGKCTNGQCDNYDRLPAMIPPEEQYKRVRVNRVEWDGQEITIYFVGRPDEPFGEREFEPGSHTRRMFGALQDAVSGIVKAYELVQGYELLGDE